MLYAVRRSPLSLRIDSTLRGPIGALVQEVLAGEPEAGVIFAPAFPESGRTTLDGRHFLYGQPIMQTEIAHDPWGPVQTDDLRQLLHSHLDEDVALLPLPLIRLGAVAIAAVLDRLPGRVVTVDAETNADLAAIVEAMCLVQQRQWIPVDAGPLSAMWAARFYGHLSGHLRISALPGHEPARVDFRHTPPVLAVCGSLMERTRGQLDVLARLPGTQVIELPAADLVEDVGRVVEYVREQWRPETPVLAVSTMPTLHTNPGAVAAGIAALTRALWESFPFAGCFLSGGDIAAATITALGAVGLNIDMEVLPLAVRSILVGGPFKGLPVVTKGGSVGDCHAIIHCITALQAT